MKKPMKTIIIPLLSVSLLGAATASHAFGGGCDQRGGKGKGAYGQKFDGKGYPDGSMRVERLAQKLDLTDAQQEQIAAIIEASSNTRESLQEKMQNNREALSEAMASDNSASVRSLADQKGDLIAELTVLRASDRSQIKAILTPEQQEEFAERKQRRRGRR